MHTIRKILAIGYSVRHIVCSGSRAGYEMYAADAFGDMDTKRCAKRHFLLNPLQLHADIKLLKAEINEVDGIIIGSGFERADFGFLTVEDRNRKILGNAPELTKEVANKTWLSARLDDLGIRHPLAYTGREIAEGEEKTKHFHYPVVAKPAYGGGGTANFFCTTEKELIRCAKQLPDFLFQEYIKGTPVSVSLISTKREAVSVSVNEQLIGLNSLCTPGPFTYCGNISPFVGKFSVSERMCEIAAELTQELGLVGSNGVDFVVTDDEPFVIEVNPRFQGSLDTVELSTGLNLVDAHVNAVKRGILIERVEARRYAAKAILFATHDGMVIENLDRDGIVDIPEKGRIIRRGEPIATGIGIGDSRGSALADAMRHVDTLQSGIHINGRSRNNRIFVKP
ncbi:MAG: ATP-grasp domain-containing protein [Methanophagales archaeon]|nr:ATP-grasp domain-containing protein [Methanophagales archaeon]